LANHERVEEVGDLSIVTREIALAIVIGVACVPLVGASETVNVRHWLKFNYNVCQENIVPNI